MDSNVWTFNQPISVWLIRKPQWLAQRIMARNRADDPSIQKMWNHEAPKMPGRRGGCSDEKHDWSYY